MRGDEIGGRRGDGEVYLLQRYDIQWIAFHYKAEEVYVKEILMLLSDTSHQDV